MAAQLLPGLERKLKAEITGDVMFDRFSRGRYATDASHYQMTPLGVVAPRTIAEAERTLALAREEGVSVLPRGGGTSQSGQTVNQSLVIDCSKYLTKIYEIDVGEKRCTVEPGIVLDDLNRKLKPYGLWFPVDVSTASRATIGGMTANNSCGGRSLRYGTMRDNVRSVDAVLADGTKAHFGPVNAGLSNLPAGSPLRPLARTLLDIGLREADEIEMHFPKVQRRVGGYNLDAFAPNAPQHNLAHILLGSEGTLAFSTRIELKLSPVLGKRVIGACHFGSFYRGDEFGAASGQAQADRRRTGRSHHDRTRERDRDVPPDAKGLRARRAGGDPAGRVRRRRGGEPAAAERTRRHDGRSRLRLRQARRQVGRRGRSDRCGAAGRDRGRAHLRPQHHDVDEGGGEADLLRRGLRGAADQPCGLHAAPHARCSRSTARAAPGTRMPRSAACMCARC